MELNGVSSSVASTAVTASVVAPKKEAEEVKKEEQGAVYEKSGNASANVASAYTASGAKNKAVDKTSIEQLRSEAEEKFSQLQSLVDKLLTKQGETYKYASLGDLMEGVKNGEVKVDPALVEQAKKDVSEDGYWGVEQTASRIVDFAKALTGGDETQIEKMRAAVEKGFAQATKTWGRELPEISGKTRDRVNELFDQWANKENEDPTKKL